MGNERDLCLVIGGNGFIGRHLVELLLREGRPVRVFDRTPCNDPRVEMFQGDIRRADEVQRACADAAIVFQCAAVVDWHPGCEQTLYEVNVLGNRNVIAACTARRNTRLVFTSSIDAVFGGRPIRNGDETLPYPTRHLSFYGHTKMVAEQETLAATGHNGLMTCAIRPAGVYGPGDPYRMPTVIAEARRGNLVRLGDGRARFNHVYVENVACVHILAADRLTPDSPVNGQCYVVTDQPARNFFDFVESFVVAMGLPAARRTIPYHAAYALATVLEGWARLTRGRFGKPLLTRSVVASTCVDCWFTSAKATRDLGYAPQVSETDAFERTLAWLNERRQVF
jgi:sterol-4alpha-carboxylate 3-dehydrogenase (decarboxylating)